MSYHSRSGHHGPKPKYGDHKKSQGFHKDWSGRPQYEMEIENQAQGGQVNQPVQNIQGYLPQNTNPLAFDPMYSDDKAFNKAQFPPEEKKISDPNNNNLGFEKKRFNDNDRPYYKKGFGKDFHHDNKKGFNKYKDDKFAKNKFDTFNSQPQPAVDLGLITDQMYAQITELKYADDEAITEEFKVSGPEIDNSLKLDIRLKKKVLQANSSEWQTFPMLVSLVADNLKSAQRSPIDLVCVLDRSGSMAGTKFNLVKKTLEYLMNYLGDLDRLSIILFNHQASRLVPLMKTNMTNKVKILSVLAPINCDGGTDINDGMMHAFQVLKSRRNINPVTSVFLLSDGLDNKAQDKVRASLVKFGVPENITINTFGFGADHDPQLMTDIADLRDGNFYFVEQLDKVDECFVDCLGGLLSSVGQAAVIKVRAEQSNALRGVEILQAYGNFSMWTYENDRTVTKFTNVMSGRQKDFVLKIRIPATKRGLTEPVTQVKIASAEATIIGLDGKQMTKTADLYVTLMDERAKIQYQDEDDKEVMKNYYRVKGAFLMDKARRLADEKQWIAARKSLQSFKDEVETSPLNSDPFIQNLIKDLETAIRNVDPDVYWKTGKHNMISNQRAQMLQKSNFTSANNYQNSTQVEMVKALQAMKGLKC